MTTTPDEVALLAAIAANPDDVGAKLAHADLVGESDPLQGCMLRILAQPDCDEWRLQYAQAIEPTDMARAWFIRTQCSLAQLRATVEAAGFSNVTSGGGAMSDRVGAMLAAHEADWRRAGPCPKCYRKVNPVTREQTPMGCNSCNGTGDRGMLCGRENTLLLSNPPKPGPFRHPVQFRRGFIEQIDATLGDVFERAEEGCPECEGLLGETAEAGIVCRTCGNRGDVAVWRPTARALAWVREFPTVARVRLVDRVPREYRFDAAPGFGWDDGYQGITEPSELPPAVYMALAGGKRFRPGDFVWYPTAEAAHDTLARAVAAALRAHKG